MSTCSTAPSVVSSATACPQLAHNYPLGSNLLLLTTFTQNSCVFKKPLMGEAAMILAKEREPDDGEPDGEWNTQVNWNLTQVETCLHARTYMTCSPPQWPSPVGPQPHGSTSQANAISLPDNITLLRTFKKFIGAFNKVWSTLRLGYSCLGKIQHWRFNVQLMVSYPVLASLQWKH